MDRNFYFILGGVIAILAVIFFAAGGKPESTDNSFSGDPLVVQSTDHVIGAGTSGVTIIEYADFACPGCGIIFNYLNQLKSEYGDQITVVYRHFPLERIHPNTLAAHRAAEAAGNQGKFWQMHDLLFSRTQNWTRQSSGISVAQATQYFEGLASELNLDLDQYNGDVSSEEIFNTISNDIDSGNKLGINSTPTLYLNGEELATPRTYDELKSAVDEAIAAVQASQSEQTTDQQPATAN